jgi:hypothetical protein
VTSEIEKKRERGERGGEREGEREETFHLIMFGATRFFIYLLETTI